MQAKDQTFEPATRQRDSVERAEERRMERSRSWERWASRSVCLCEPSAECEGKCYEIDSENVHLDKKMIEQETHLPISKPGAAIGDNSVVMVKTPSNFLSGFGATIEAETHASALAIVHQHRVVEMRLERSWSSLCVSQLYISNPIILAESQFNITKGEERAPVKADVFS